VASPIKSSTSSASGAACERAAARFLQARGYVLCHRNWRCPGGELDLVAEDGETLVFVEVRARASRAGYTAEETVGPAKVRRLVHAAEAYLASHPWDGPCRFDLVAITIGDTGLGIRLIRDAFEL
jgi:putative endonuclease